MQAADGPATSSIARVETGALEALIDAQRFGTGCEELVERSDLPPDDAQVITEFLEAWRQTEAGRRG